MDRRTFLECLGVVALAPVLTGSQEASSVGINCKDNAFSLAGATK
jgi:hypothetical protein